MSVVFEIPKSHRCYSCKCHKLSMLPLISVEVFTQHKCYKFLCSELVPYIKGRLQMLFNSLLIVGHVDLISVWSVRIK